MKTIEINGVMTTPENAGWLAFMQPEDTYCVSSNIIRAIKDCSEDLCISINTPGGDVDALDAIVASLTDWTIEHPKCALELRVQALAASCGAALLIFAPRVNTTVSAYATSRIMFHGAMTSLDWAGADNCKDAAAMLDSYNNTLKNALLARSKVPPSLINSWFAASREGWLNAEDALKYGIVDRIIDADANLKPAPAPHISNLTLEKLQGFITMKQLNIKNEEPKEPTPEEPEKTTPQEPAAPTPEEPKEPENNDAPTPEEPTPEEPVDDDTPPWDEPEEPAPEEPKPEEEIANLRNQLATLQAKVTELTNALNKVQAMNKKLTPGLNGNAPKATPANFHAALANMRKEHPGMSYDDAFCMTAAQHPALYKALRNQ